MRRARWHAVWAIAATVGVLSMTGCGDVSDNPYQKTDPTSTAKAAEQLGKLGSLEDTEAQVKAAVEQLGSYVSSLVPGLTWSWYRDRSQVACDPPYDQTPGEKVTLQNYIASAGIPDSV